MLEFIVCDDDKDFLEKVISIINKFMMKKKIEYKILKYYDFDSSFMKMIVSKETLRIYILDIEVPSHSGITIGKVIRKNDLESPIIFLTGHEELGNLLLRKDINFFAFINKFEDFPMRLRKNIELALNSLNKRQFLEIKDRKTYYRFSLDNIMYITRESVERKTIIKTDKNIHCVNKTLMEISKALDDRFIQTHRSCYVNKDRVVEINYKRKVIVFDSGETINLLSLNYKGKIKL